MAHKHLCRVAPALTSWKLTVAADIFNPAYIGKRADVLQLLPAGARRVLDVGCSNGEVGLDLKLRGSVAVTGVELDPDMAAAASTRLDKVFCGTAEAFFDDQAYVTDRYDAIIMADVLKHMPDPWRVLRVARERLTDGGFILISLPNVRHFDTIVNLVFRGVWPYRDRGIHDRTHLRFFTWINITQLLHGAGLHCHEVRPNYRLIERPHRLNRHAKWVRYLPGVRNFFVFQYVIRAQVVG